MVFQLGFVASHSCADVLYGSNADFHLAVLQKLKLNFVSNYFHVRRQP